MDWLYHLQFVLYRVSSRNSRVLCNNITFVTNDLILLLYLQAKALEAGKITGMLCVYCTQASADVVDKLSVLIYTVLHIMNVIHM